MKKVLFLFSVSFFTLISSCNTGKGGYEGQESTITTSKLSLKDSLFKDISKDSMKVSESLANLDTIRNKDIVVDTIVSNYHIIYTIKTNDNIVIDKYYSGVTGEPHKAYYADRSVYLNIKSKEKTIMQNKEINKQLFKLLIGDGVNKYLLQWFDIYQVKDDSIIFYIGFCMPDSDVCDSFYIHVNEFGIFSVELVDEGEMGA